MKKYMCGALILNGNINSMLLDNNDNNDDDGVVWFISQHLAATKPDRPTDQLTDRRAYISNAIVLRQVTLRFVLSFSFLFA